MQNYAFLTKVRVFPNPEKWQRTELCKAAIRTLGPSNLQPLPHDFSINMSLHGSNNKPDIYSRMHNKLIITGLQIAQISILLLA
jgi:hypothetical protein